MLEQMTAAQMAVRVGISERSIQRWMQEGRLQAKRLEDSSLYEVETADLDHLRLRGHREEESRLQAVERKVTEMRYDLDAALFQHQDHLTALERKVTEGGETTAELRAALQIALEQIRQLTSAFEAHLGEIGTQLHDMRIVFLSDVWRTAPEAIQAVQSRLDTLEQRLATLETTAATKTTPETESRPKTPRTRPAQPAERGGEGVELPSDLVSARAFAGKHGIHENTLDKAIKSGRIPVETGRWKDGAAWVQKALDQAGQARFVELYHSNPHFHQCDDPECPCHEQI